MIFFIFPGTVGVWVYSGEYVQAAVTDSEG